MLVERGAQRADAPVHHVARRDGVGARGGLGDGGAGEQLERGVVVDDAVGAQHAAVAVARVLAQAQVGDHEQVGIGGLDRARGELDDALVVPRARALLVLGRRAARTAAPPGCPARATSPASRTAASIERWSTPGIDGIGVRPLLPVRRRTSGTRGGAPRARSRARGRGCRSSRAAGAGGWRGRPWPDGSRCVPTRSGAATGARAAAEAPSASASEVQQRGERARRR